MTRGWRFAARCSSAVAHPGDFRNTEFSTELTLGERSRIGERFEHLRSSLPDIAEAFGQNLNVAIPQPDVVGRSRPTFEANGLADNKCCGFSLGFAHSFAGAGPAITPVKKLVSLCCAQHKRTYVAMEFMWRTE